MTTYPGLPGPTIEDHLSREESRDRYAPGTEFQIGRIELVANTGTYLDTPAHRFAGGYDLADLDLGRCADLPGRCIRATGPAIDVAAVEGVDVAGRAVLFATGWSRYWRTERYGDPSHPYLTASLARSLAEGGAVLVGIDSVNIDDTAGGERPVHTILLGAGIPIVEHLTGLEPLVNAEFRFFAVPVRVRAMGTFPVRAFAIL
jgi:kynurenine formamidase